MSHEPSPSRYETLPYRRCGRSGLKLPVLSLGLWHNFGGVDSPDTARDMILRAFDLGITHFDLANNYGPPAGSAEVTFGKVLRENLSKHRDELVISTKAGYYMWPGPYGEWGSRKYLLASLDQSLSRMGLEYVDIFYSHRFDPETPLEETMGALAHAVKSGKALYAGISSYKPNATRVAKIAVPRTFGELQELVRSAAKENTSIALAGCRHAMGGQQFATDGLLIDLRELNQVVAFERDRGLIHVQAGIQWPALLAGYQAAQTDGRSAWGIAQKQTGADTFTLGGSLSANAHGRGLRMRPLIQDVEAFTLLKSNGEFVRCSREENSDLFGLAIGGYGLFGIISEVTLRLTPRRCLERVVKLISADELPEQFASRIDEGFLYGDFQFSIDEQSDDFLRRGVFSCYRPVEQSAPEPAARSLDESSWLKLLHLAHTDRARAFQKYTDHYLSTNGQTYWSDTHQLGPYLPDYAQRVQQLSGATTPSSLMISELYVPRSELPAFLEAAARELRSRGAIVIYGTVRLIEKDTESFLPWARESYGCVIFNLLVEHTAEGKENAAAAFRALIDLAISRGGSYFLTYHRFATKRQVEACYPQFPEFLALKKKHDPNELFQSDWYRHYRGMFGA